MSRMIAADSYGQWESLANQRDQMASQNFFQALQARQRDAAMAEEIRSRNQSRLLQALLAARDQANMDRAFDFNVAVNKSKLDLDRQELADRLSQNLWTRDYQDRSLAQRDKPSPREFADIQTAIANGEMAPEDAKAFGFTPEQVAALRQSGEYANESKQREFNMASRFVDMKNRYEQLKEEAPAAKKAYDDSWWIAGGQSELKQTSANKAKELKEVEDWLATISKYDPSLEATVRQEKVKDKGGKERNVWMLNIPSPVLPNAQPGTTPPSKPVVVSPVTSAQTSAATTNAVPVALQPSLLPQTNNPPVSANWSDGSTPAQRAWMTRNQGQAPTNTPVAVRPGNVDDGLTPMQRAMAARNTAKTKRTITKEEAQKAYKRLRDANPKMTHEEAKALVLSM